MRSEGESHGRTDQEDSAEFICDEMKYPTGRYVNYAVIDLCKLSKS